MRKLLPCAFAAIAVAALPAQCPYFANGTISAGLSRVGGGEDARLVYVDCLASIGLVRAKFGGSTGSSALNGLPLTLAIYDDPNDDHNPIDAVLVRLIPIPGGITGANTNTWQTYDIAALSGTAVPTTGGMWVALGVQYVGAPSPGPSSIEFSNNNAPGTQWMATSSSGGTLTYNSIGTSNRLVDLQTGPGFPPGSWVMTVESGADYRAFGNGCQGSNGVPTLAGDPLFPPGLGLPANLTVANLPIPPVAGAMVLALVTNTPAPDLGTLLGAAPIGCLLHVQPLDFVVLVSSNGNAGYAFVVPNNAGLVGLSVFAQALSLDGAANALGITASNGLRVVVGH